MVVDYLKNAVVEYESTGRKPYMQRSCLRLLEPKWEDEASVKVLPNEEHQRYLAIPLLHINKVRGMRQDPISCVCK